MDNVFNRVARRRRSSEGGFTLIELLVVIAILAILAAVVLFNIVGVTNRGQSVSCKTDEKSVTAAAAAYYSDHSNAWPAIAGQTGTGDSTAGFGGLVTAYLQQQPPATDGVWALDTTTGAATSNGTGC